MVYIRLNKRNVVFPLTGLKFIGSIERYFFLFRFAMNPYHINFVELLKLGCKAAIWKFKVRERQKKNPRSAKNRVDRVKGNTTNFFGLMRNASIACSIFGIIVGLLSIFCDGCMLLHCAVLQRIAC